MTRLIAIAFLMALAFVLFRYRLNENVQKSVILSMSIGFISYIAFVMITELIR